MIGIPSKFFWVVKKKVRMNPNFWVANNHQIWLATLRERHRNIENMGMNKCLGFQQSRLFPHEVTAVKWRVVEIWKVTDGVAVCDDLQLASHESCSIGRSELVRLWKQTECLEQVLTCSDVYGVMKMFTADCHARLGRSSSWLRRPSMLRTTCRACTSPERVGASFTLCESCSCNRRSLKQQIEDLKRRSPAMHQPAETANASQEGMHSTPTFLMAEIGRAPSEEWTMWQVMAAPMTSWASLKMWRKREFLWPSRRVLREGLCTGSWSLSGRTIWLYVQKDMKEFCWKFA